MQRYFSKEKIDNHFILNNEDIYHITKVMRMKDNEKIIVVYQNIPHLCCLENVNKNIEIRILKELESNNDNIIDITLIIPVLKEQKMDYIIQKATELGVKRIIPFKSERGIVKVDQTNENKKVMRWQKILKEASEQSHRNDIPEITKIFSLDDIININGIKVVCSTTTKEKNIKNVLKSNIDCGTMSIVVGPEGGLSKIEETKLIENGFIPVSLGNRIMRVETVPLFIMSIVNYEFME